MVVIFFSCCKVFGKQVNVFQLQIYYHFWRNANIIVLNVCIYVVKHNNLF